MIPLSDPVVLMDDKFITLSIRGIDLCNALWMCEPSDTSMIDEMIAALAHVKNCARHNAELFNNAHEIATNYQRQCITRAGRTEATK